MNEPRLSAERKALQPGSPTAESPSRARFYPWVIALAGILALLFARQPRCRMLCRCWP
ncbi:MAG TPA: hypothetical protein VH280_14605 [Verrucomicrobiae bacterium]|nr:hypothetical protein [Verrucomicrobiae bacterium]